ncbi:MAG: type II toxin-antitoxin system RelE/ParE family toxin [Proteobacteria bacterium]|nr:type II toxin-antitoxin system RelE/ParE family toxin [Pseudomonadota bacterium]
MKVLQMPAFKKAYKRLHTNQKKSVDDAITEIIKDPLLGTGKKGDLAGVFVYKFNCIKQEFLLAYEFDIKTRILLALGVHENFYRDLKNK